MRSNQIKIRSLFGMIVLFVSFVPFISNASTINGSILDKYAWGDNVGWINFSPAQGGVSVTDSALSGYAWDSNFGWINLSPSQSGVKNDGAGHLSGSAWSAGGGFIDFAGVTISSSGKFSGTATGSTYGHITFDCGQCSVTTDWRPVSARSTSSSFSGSYTNGSGSYMLPPIDINTVSSPPKAIADITNGSSSEQLIVANGGNISSEDKSLVTESSSVRGSQISSRSTVNPTSGKDGQISVADNKALPSNRVMIISILLIAVIASILIIFRSVIFKL